MSRPAEGGPEKVEVLRVVEDAADAGPDEPTRL